MLRTSLVPLALVVAASGADAQTQSPHTSDAMRVTGPVKYAGRFDAATGTWTRGAATVSNFGQPDNLYSNTAGSGYFTGVVGPTGAAAGGLIIDDGAIPSTGDPTPFALGGPMRDASNVNTVQIGYCDFDTNPGVAGFTINFYNSYSPCTFPTDPAQLAGSAVLTGGPSNGCWVVDIAVDFDILHDGDGTHSGTAALDNFGIEWSYTGGGLAAAGPLIAGDPANTDAGWIVGNVPEAGSNTYYGSISNCAGVGSGYRTGDFHWIEDVNMVGGLPAGSNCYFFGGYNNTGSGCGGPVQTPYGSFHVELSGSGTMNSTISVNGCTGNNNATGVPGDIEVTGSINPANNDAVLRAFNLPPNQFGIFATGREGIPPGTVNSGNGTICINPTAQGGLGRFAGMNQVKNSGATGEFTLDTNAGEWNVGMIPTSVGTYAAMAGVTSHFQAWHREPVGAGFNFTGSCLVSW